MEDLALALPLIASTDTRDPHIVPVSLADPHDVEVKGLRMAFFTDSGICPAGPETVAVIGAAAKHLASAGAQVEEIRPPGIEGSFDLYNSIRRADAGAAFRDMLEGAGTKVIDAPLMRS